MGLTLIRSISGEEGGSGETGEGVEQVVRSVRGEETSRVWHKLPASVSLSSSKLLSQSLWPGHWSAPRLGTRKVVSSKLPGSSRAVRGLHVSAAGPGYLIRAAEPWPHSTPSPARSPSVYRNLRMLRIEPVS